MNSEFQLNSDPAASLSFFSLASLCDGAFFGLPPLSATSVGLALAGKMCSKRPCIIAKTGAETQDPLGGG